jgi:hypothetical protein
MPAWRAGSPVGAIVQFMLGNQDDRNYEGLYRNHGIH